MKICVIRAIREPKLLSMFYSLTDITDSTDLSLGRLFRKPVAVSNMKICVIRAIREPKYKLCFYSLTDFTDFTDMEPWAALDGVTSCSRQHENLCDPCNP